MADFVASGPLKVAPMSDHIPNNSSSQQALSLHHLPCESFDVHPLDSENAIKSGIQITLLSFITRSNIDISKLTSKDSFQIIPDSKTLNLLQSSSNMDGFLGYSVLIKESEEATLKQSHALLIPSYGSIYLVLFLRTGEELPQQQQTIVADTTTSTAVKLNSIFHKDQFLSQLPIQHKLVKLPNESYLKSFSMKPPSSLSTIEDSPTKLTNVDPQEFLAERYFSTLYKDTIPLQFFTKTALPRTHVLAHSNTPLVKESLNKFVIKSMLDFDNRNKHIIIDLENALKTDDDGFINENHLLDPAELPYRKLFAESLKESSEDKINEAITTWKIREAKLQILLSLELLKLVIDGDDDDVSKGIVDQGLKSLVPMKPKTKRVRLVGRKKRLVPTLIGTAVPANIQFTTDFRETKETEDNAIVLSKSVLEMNISSLFDKLCVWDAISGVSAKNDSSAYNFLMSSVIPFFQKTHLKLLKDLVNKSRGPSVSKKQREVEKKRTKRDATVVERQEKPALSRASSTLGDIDLSSLQLKRSTSTLNSSRPDFSKKTFEMISSTSFSQQPFNLSQSESQPNSQSNSQPSKSQQTQPQAKLLDFEKGIFTQHRKRKLGTSKPTSNSNSKAKKSNITKSSTSLEVTQIEATPMKSRTKNLLINKTDSKSQSTNEHKFLVIEESPIKKMKLLTPSKTKARLERRQVIIDSSPFKRPSSSSSTYLNKSPTAEGIVINSSPETLKTGDDWKITPSSPIKILASPIAYRSIKKPNGVELIPPTPPTNNNDQINIVSPTLSLTLPTKPGTVTLPESSPFYIHRVSDIDERNGSVDRTNRKLKFT
ncbi:hypothetical protein CANARDRAFT_29066 [[Candida] arabinofermentans NRRL YB-2248]|uniref:DNA replication regulator Sld3 C-terminal domain-containing protein n=1 Tax=[Candida] arabinofermentans NRRL YB-2248 TaxID=983967 RepID=A0A1E4SYG4_9ASCO|nr:hypothetical protein CANARDRAFT_29066 [[Candida] arabinofermentans NRRL YB-2248]